ncbi:MAG: low affinity iron permease family protein [Acidimicrobiales bacterium]
MPPARGQRRPCGWRTGHRDATVDGEGPSATERLSRWRSWSGRDRIVPRAQQLTRRSRLLYRIDHYRSLPVAALVVVGALTCPVIVGAALRFPPRWLSGLEVGTSVVTLMMIIVIQHTQDREQAATQRKLDELLCALPGAEAGRTKLEEAPADGMRDVEKEQRESKGMATNEYT